MKRANIPVAILCGGKGRRLRSVSAGIPKPMLDVGGRPFLDLLIASMSSFGFRHFILLAGYKAEWIRRYYQRPMPSGITVRVVAEPAALGTGGAIKHLMRLTDAKTLFVLNGDSFCRFNPLRMLAAHYRQRAVISILLRKVAHPGEYGGVALDQSLRVRKFQEKSLCAAHSWVNAGVYIFSRRIAGRMPAKKSFSLENDFFPQMVNERMCGFPCRGYFIDIGTPLRLAQARRYFFRYRVGKLPGHKVTKSPSHEVTN